MSNGMPDDDDIGTTFSKLSKRTTVKGNYKDGTAEEGRSDVESTMETGQAVQYDDISNGSYPPGTGPGLSKNWGAKDETGLAAGFDNKRPVPAYLEGGGPKTVDF